MITTLIAYAAGTQEILDVCLSAIERHEAGADSEIRVITNKKGYLEALDVVAEHDAQVYAYDIGDMRSGSAMHGMMLDMAVKEVVSEYVLTLDSDCFPVADGWLSELLGMIDNGAVLSGILWPWVPPPDSVDEMTIEYRIRQSHCWANTQVACQLVRKSFLVANNLKYVDGDDTGLGITERARKLGMLIDGWRPTRCPLTTVTDFDPEMNRHVCVVFGDRMYHQGGSTRKLQGANVDPMGMYDYARERVFEEKGAEWILDDALSYKYKYNREEEVAQFKMEIMFSEMRKYLEKNERLFS